MGGYNSGRHGGKRTTNDMHVLDIRKIARAGLLKPGLFVQLAVVARRRKDCIHRLAHRDRPHGSELPQPVQR